MGRLVGLPFFLSEKAYAEEKADTAEIRREKGGATDDIFDLEEDESAMECQIAIAQRMQHQFEGRILRRTTESVNWRGEKLIPLPPFKEIMIVVKPTQRESEIMQELADRVKERLVLLWYSAHDIQTWLYSVSTSNGVLQIVSRSFYIEHRMAVNYARLNLSEKPPVFKTLAEWETKKSTKIDTCARIIKHILSRDDAPELEVVDGKIHIPDLPPLSPEQLDKLVDKAILYQEYPSLGPLLHNVGSICSHLFSSLIRLRSWIFTGLNTCILTGEQPSRTAPRLSRSSANKTRIAC